MNQWMRDIFDANQANNGGVVRRATRNVATFGASGGGLAGLVAEARRQGFHVIETGDQIVILCNSGVLKVHC
ncbi:MAG: N-(5'-phosphoribosyl)anthranilate isomerase [Anaerolinea sp.]|jgi:putative NIF3 family GTP cyclohydrolase 1 type 2|nr:N-(5'-phosphoribosyl)anthranilate isomerase [Anaerolinea sp.]